MAAVRSLCARISFKTAWNAASSFHRRASCILPSIIRSPASSASAQEPTPASADLASGAQARRTRALVCGGVTRSEKAFVSQCAPEAPIGVTFREKLLRYQRTAQSVLNRAAGEKPPGRPPIRPTKPYGISAEVRPLVHLDFSRLDHTLAHFSVL